MDPDIPPPDRPFYRRSGFWIGLGCILPLVIGGAIAWVDAHGRQYAAEMRARLPQAMYTPQEKWPVPPAVPSDDNFCADPLIAPLFRSGSIRSGRGGSVFDLVSKLDNLVELTFSEGTWHGPDSPCSSRSWGTLDEPMTFKSGRDRRAISKYGPIWDSLVPLFPSGPTEPPKTTVELARLLNEARLGAFESGKCFADLEARLAAPRARLPDNVWLSSGSWDPDWYVHRHFLDLTSVIEARGQLALENDDPATAFRSAGILLRLASAIHDVGSKKGRLREWGSNTQERVAALVWLAARDQQWQADQWRSLAGWTSTVDFRQAGIDEVRRVLDDEMTGLRQRLSYPGLRAGIFHGYHYSDVGEELARLIPYGWYTAALAHADFDNWQYLQAFERVEPPAWPLGVLRSPSAESSALSRSFGYGRFSRDNWGSGDNLRSLVIDWATAHVVNEVIRTTAALEQAFARRGAYPESLQELVPEWLPRVPIDLDGKPLRYALEPRNGRYRIWSVGSDEIDDGGWGWRIKARPTELWKSRGIWPSPSGSAKDWVWQYP